MPRTNAYNRVGTLDTAVDGRKLSVYMRVDGSLFFKVDGVREDMHGNTRWTSTSGAKMRGKTPIDAAQQASRASGPPASRTEQDDLEAAIAASLQDFEDVEDVPDNPSASGGHTAAGAPTCVVCLTDAADRVIKPCGHLCLCGVCASRFQRDRLPCPVCRRAQRSIDRVYFA